MPSLSATRPNADALISDAAASTRYVLACAAFAAMALCPLLTLCYCWPEPRLVTAVEEPVTDSEPAELGATSSGAVAGSAVFPGGGTAEAAPQHRAPIDPFGQQSYSPSARPLDGPMASAPTWDSRLRPLIPWLVGGWLAGVLLLSLRLVAIWVCVQRLRRIGVSPVSAELQSLLARLAAQLAVSRPVRLLQSTLVEVPAVIGWFSPVILLPASAVTGLSSEQLEAILIHELAHIRRGDYLVNLLQNVVETLLFYHPAVWWVSNIIRQEREHCCDDLAARRSGGSAGYVAALLKMEELRVPAKEVALAARGGDLLARAQRLLGVNDGERSPTRWPSAALAAVVVASMALVAWGLTGRAADVERPDAVEPKKTRVLEFPNDRSLGILYWRERASDGDVVDWDQAWKLPGWSDTWRRVANARGTVRIASDRDLWLDVDKAAASDLSPLSKLPADALQALSLPVETPDTQLRHLAGLKGLRCLAAGGANVTDAGLAVLTELKKLERLSISSTQVGDETAALLTKLPSLRWLLAYRTKITDAGMRHIGSMPRLEYLAIGSDSITADGLAEIAGQSSLRRLDLSSLPVIDSSVRSLAKLRNLESLTLSGDLLTSACAADLARLTKLEQLKVYNGESLADGALEELAKLPRLEAVHLPGKVTKRGMRALGRMQSLKNLQIWGGSANEEDLSYLAALPQLEELHVRDLTNGGAARLAESKSLKRLWLFRGPLDDEGLKALARLPLEMLLMMNETKISWAGLDALGEPLQMKELRLLAPLEGKPTLKFLDRMPALKQLIIHPPAPDLPLEEWAHLANVPQLESLTLYSLADDASVRHLAGLTALRKLSLRGPITDDGLKTLSGLTALDSLHLGGDPQVTDRGLEHLAPLSALSGVTIESSLLTNAGLAVFASRMPRLVRLRTKQEIPVAKPRDALVGRPAPDFTLTTLDGKKFRLSDQRGKTVVVHFWATNIDAAEGFLPEFKQLHTELAHRDDLEFISIALDESDAPVRKLVERHGLTWPQAMVDAERKIAANYRVTGRPHFFIVNADGLIVADPYEPGVSEALRRELAPAGDDPPVEDPAFEPRSGQ
ncbi:MAG: M56 family metallopeptidase [Planctomycetaceae bacterium]